jgi:hypothetical protein
MSELVDNDELRPARQRRVHVELLERSAAILDLAAW